MNIIEHSVRIFVAMDFSHEFAILVEFSDQNIVRSIRERHEIRTARSCCKLCIGCVELVAYAVEVFDCVTELHAFWQHV